MAKAIQIAANNANLFVLADDGRLARWEIATGNWTLIALPAGVQQRERKVEVQVQHRNLPTGYEAWRDGESGLWQWKKGNEVSAIFGSIEDAVSDAKQKHLLATLPRTS